jgi:hypothetical protein
MQKIKKMFRANYTGEELVREMHYVDGDWVKTVESVPNVIENIQLSGKAVVLGNGTSRVDMDKNLLSLLKNHKGGLLASGAVQTYGCNAIVRDFIPDFVVANDSMASELVNDGYCDQTIIYGTGDMVLAYPGKFYLVPQTPNWNMGATAAYLACFDGHKTVYLVGHDLHSNEKQYQTNVYAGTRGYPDLHSPTTEKYFELAMLNVMKMYNEVDFVRVAPTHEYYMPDSWKYLLNLRTQTYREFVLEVDLG